MMTEMEIMVVFPFEDVSEWGSDHTENGGIKRCEVQIVNIDFHQSRESHSRGDQSDSALRTLRISH